MNKDMSLKPVLDLYATKLNQYFKSKGADVEITLDTPEEIQGFLEAVIKTNEEFKFPVQPKSKNASLAFFKTINLHIIPGYSLEFSEPKVTITFWKTSLGGIFVKINCILVSSTEIEIFTKMCEDFSIKQVIHVDNYYLTLENLQQIVKTLLEVQNDGKK